MMNKLKVIAALLAVVLLMTQCETKKEAESASSESPKEEAGEWKAMDDFHMIMAETFHPFKDSANLAPIKTQAAELVASADAWVNSGLPEKMNTEEVKAKLQELKSEAQVLADQVKTSTDAEIGKQLEKVHDKFHEIQEMWYGESGHKHEHKH